MCSLPCVTIDASVLAVPQIHCTKSDAFLYVDTLLDWSKLLDEPWIAIYMSERASGALFDDGLYPLRAQLDRLFSAHNIIEYDVNTVAKVADRLLSLTPSFETYYRVRDVLTGQFEAVPDIVRLTTHNSLQTDLMRCITLMAILRKHCPQPLSGHSLILKNAPNQMIQIKAQIHDIEHLRDDIPALPVPPDFFAGEVLVCNDFYGLIQCIDESVILVGAPDNLGIEIAIKIALFKHAIAQGDSPGWEGEIVPAIGPRFRELCQRVCAAQDDSLPPRILRAIIETIKRYNLTDVHALRTGAGGNAPHRMRGNDKAQRRDIDRTFHLHYWECCEGTIELASVVYHDDFSIPE